MEAKKKLWSRVLETTVWSGPTPRVNVSRKKAAEHAQDPEKSPNGEASLFGQIYSQLSSASVDVFRSSGNVYSVKLVGEGADDAG